MFSFLSFWFLCIILLSYYEIHLLNNYILFLVWIYLVMVKMPRLTDKVWENLCYEAKCLIQISAPWQHCFFPSVPLGLGLVWTQVLWVWVFFHVILSLELQEHSCDHIFRDNKQEEPTENSKKTGSSEALGVNPSSVPWSLRLGQVSIPGGSLGGSG